MQLPNGDNLWVLLLEVALALALFGYLFLRRKSSFGPASRALQRVEVKLSGGFSPSEVRLQAGRPTQLLIHRFEQAPADELFEIEELGIYELLPALHTTVIAFQPEKRGRFPMILAGEKRAGTMIIE